MTKQRPSATKLRLSRLFRWLAVLCFIKLSILGMLMLDLPLPAWLGRDTPDNGARPAQTAAHAPAVPGRSLENAAVADGALSLNTAQMPETNQVQGSAEPAGPSLVTSQEPPQGAAAAQLAAAAKPRHAVPQSVTEAALPAPLAASQTLPVGRSAFVPPDLPEPAALDAPAVEPGTAPLAGNNAPLLAVARRPAQPRRRLGRHARPQESAHTRSRQRAGGPCRRAGHARAPGSCPERLTLCPGRAERAPDHAGRAGHSGQHPPRTGR